MKRINLKIFRIKQELSQEKMAEKIGVSRSIYRDIESGKRNCNDKFMTKLQTAFNIPDASMWELVKTHDDNGKER